MACPALGVCRYRVGLSGLAAVAAGPPGSTEAADWARSAAPQPLVETAEPTLPRGGSAFAVLRNAARTSKLKVETVVCGPVLQAPELLR